MAKTSAGDQVVPDSATSQFHINLNNNSAPDDNFSVFAGVVSVMSVVDAISAVTTDSNDRPLEDVTLIGARALISAKLVD